MAQEYSDYIQNQIKLSKTNPGLNSNINKIQIIKIAELFSNIDINSFLKPIL